MVKIGVWICCWAVLLIPAPSRPLVWPRCLYIGHLQGLGGKSKARRMEHDPPLARPKFWWALSVSTVSTFHVCLWPHLPTRPELWKRRCSAARCPVQSLWGHPSITASPVTWTIQRNILRESGVSPMWTKGIFGQEKNMLQGNPSEQNGCLYLLFLSKYCFQTF